MHELSIAQEIIDVAVNTIPPEKHSLVRKIRIELGEFSNIMPDSLSFCFNTLIGSSEISYAMLEVNVVPLQICCEVCNSSIEIQPPNFFCSKCGSTEIKIISGQELSIKEIELDETTEENR